MVFITYDDFGLWPSLGFFSLADLLDDELRALLMASQPPGLTLRLAGDEITVFMDGLARTTAQIEEMIALASALADRCRDAQPSAK